MAVKKINPFKKTDPFRQGQSIVRGEMGPSKPPSIVEKEVERTGGTYVSSKTGKPSGIELPGGRTLLGLSPQEVKEIKQREDLMDIPTIAEAAQAEQIQKLAGGVGATGPIGTPTADEISYEQAAKSALGLTAAGIAGGAATGAAAGLIGGPAAPVTVPVAAAIGGIVGGVNTFVAAFRGNIKAQRGDILSGESANIRKQEQNLLKIVMDTNQGGDPQRNLGYFNEQLSIIDQNHANLKLQTTDSLSFWLGEDGHVELERYATFNTPGGMRDILIGQMQQALLTPDPSKIVNFADVEAE